MWFPWDWNAHLLEPIHHTVSGRLTAESKERGVKKRSMMNWTALTNTGTGRCFTVASLTVLPLPYQPFNPSHVETSPCPFTLPLALNTLNTRICCRVRLVFSMLTFARQKGALNDKGVRHEWLQLYLPRLPPRHPLDGKKIDGDVCLSQLSFYLFIFLFESVGLLEERAAGVRRFTSC